MSHLLSIRSRFLTCLATSLSCLILAGSFVTPVFAQDNKKSDTLEEVTVTGSRIVRRDYESNSPIVTVGAEQFESQSSLNIESYLNKMPEYNPAASPTQLNGPGSNSDVQITPTNSVGIASISLRGFGPNRSLVLIDGHRPVPVNALMVTDINGIPSALIQRVETITGGASATYGADAVGGVTNFILRKDFEGLEFDGQYGISEAGDGDENRVSALLGANFADGRGNVTMGLERYERKAALQKKRSVYKDYWRDPQTAGSFIFIQGTNAYSCNVPQGCPSFAAVKGLFGGQNPSAWFAGFTPDAAEMPTYIDINFNSDGTIWSSGFPFQTPIGQSKFKGTKDGLQYANFTALDASDPTGQATMDGIKWNYTDAYASAPQDRYSIYASGNFKITDNIKVFGTANYTESKTRTILFGTDAISGWEASVPYDPNVDSPVDPTLDYTDAALMTMVAANPAAYANPNFIPHGAAGAHFPVPPELAILLNSRPAAKTAADNGRWQPQWYPDTSLPPRNTFNTIATWQVEGGVDFNLPIKDWTGEVYFSHGQSSTYNEAGGNLSATRYRKLINYPDYGANSAGTGNTFYTTGTNAANAEIVSTIRPAFGVGDFTCTSGFYDTLFGGDQPLSSDCFNAIDAHLQTRTEMTQDIVEVNLQGGVIDLPAGEVRSAIGYQHRAINGRFIPDILQSENSFADQVVGVYPTGYLDADTTADDLYVEALIPVVKDLPFMQKFELETGARYSMYKETNNNEWTYKILGNWEVKDWLRMRGGYNRASRSPNLGELFLNPQEVFVIGGANFGDPCSVRANAPYGAGGTTQATDPVIGANEPPPSVAPGQTQAGADRTYAICTAMMGPTAANTFYNTGLDVTAQGAGGGFNWVLQQGNPLLQPETADTWTAGFVLRSPLENPWLSNITLSFDWYKIDIKNAIMTFSIDVANYRCFGADTGLDPVAQAASPACQLVPRDQINGAALNTTISYDNQATINTSGFDVGFNWGADFADLGFQVPGNLGLSIQATILDYYVTKQSPADFDVETDWKGSLGPNLPGTNAGAYDYRLFTTLTYSLDSWAVTLRWRNLPGVYTAAYAAQKALIKNNERVAAGGDGLILGYTPLTEVQTDSYNVFDLSAYWNINEKYSVRAGITNLLDTSPPNVGSSTGYAPGSDLNVCNSAPGCQNPTAYSLPVKGPFNGGYYDTLGRSFFVGLKATF